MRLLIIGGTRFVGRHVAEMALARGDDVTLFHRGKTGADLFHGVRGVRHVLGDRESGSGAFAALGDQTWDAVFDPSGYVPRVVDLAARFFAARAERYVFVSSISVYRDFAAALDEDAPVGVLDDPTREDVAGDSYGPLKALCEQVVLGRFGARATILRPGVIAGAYDPTDRFTYWTRTVGAGEPFVAPGDGERLTQITDARDLASFALHGAAGAAAGVFNVTGDAVPFRTFLRAVGEGTGTAPRPAWVAEADLERLGIAPWSDMPLFLPGQDQRAANGRAKAAGLAVRSLVDTARAVDAWDAARGRPPLVAGLRPEQRGAALECGKLES